LSYTAYRLECPCQDLLAGKSKQEKHSLSTTSPLSFTFLRVPAFCFAGSAFLISLLSCEFCCFSAFWWSLGLLSPSVFSVYPRVRRGFQIFSGSCYSSCLFCFSSRAWFFLERSSLLWNSFISIVPVSEFLSCPCFGIAAFVLVDFGFTAESSLSSLPFEPSCLSDSDVIFPVNQP
jgi:hypothetical protein